MKYKTKLNYNEAIKLIENARTTLVDFRLEDQVKLTRKNLYLVQFNDSNVGAGYYDPDTCTIAKLTGNISTEVLMLGNITIANGIYDIESLNCIKSYNKRCKCFGEIITAIRKPDGTQLNFNTGG